MKQVRRVVWDRVWHDLCGSVNRRIRPVFTKVEIVEETVGQRVGTMVGSEVCTHIRNDFAQ